MSAGTCSDVWKVDSERAKKTVEAFPELTPLCDLVLKGMVHLIDPLMHEVISKWGKKELPPYQQFVSTYFIRNTLYLRGACLLAYMSLCEPSRDLQRTVAETIMRGYLFIVNRKEADLMYSDIEGTIKPEERDALRIRKYWPFRLLLGELYTKKTRKSLKKFLNRLSRSSHPSIMSAFTDLKYHGGSVKDCLNIVLALSYHNIQMMAEGFLSFLNEDLKNIIRKTLEMIADFQMEIVLLEPDKEEYSMRIKLKKGNFKTILK